MEEKEYQQFLLSNQLCFPLYAAARKTVSLYTPYFKEAGLTYTQYIVLMVLWECKTVTMGELCSRLYLDSGTLTPMLKKMEAQGWVERSRNPRDERVVDIRITEAGLDLREALKNVPQQVGNCLNLEPEEVKTLYLLLYKILGGDTDG